MSQMSEFPQTTYIIIYILENLENPSKHLWEIHHSSCLPCGSPPSSSQGVVGDGTSVGTGISVGESGRPGGFVRRDWRDHRGWWVEFGGFPGETYPV